LLALGIGAITKHYVRLYTAEPRQQAAESRTPETTSTQHADNETPSDNGNPYERHRDPPLAEGLLILLGVGGLFVPVADDNPRLFRNLWLMGLVLTLIAYGAWWWTEVLYDQQVIHSFPTV